MVPPSSHSQAVLPGSNLLLLESIDDEQTRFVLNVRSEQDARCPLCKYVSKAFHSRYTRTLQDLPWQGRQVRLRVDVRRFRCRNRCCARKIFAEQLPDVVRQYARRTNRVLEVVRMVGYSAGGLPGSRVLDRLSMPLSDDTILRVVKRSCGTTSSAPVRHLGVDDWAWKKGQNYGTILVDLDQHRVVDLLPGRSAEELSCWLQQHADVEVIARDRCGIYAEGATAGAPSAVQVADRFHLLVNLSAALERVLEGCSAQLSSTGTSPVAASANESAPMPDPILTPGPEASPTQQQIGSRQRRQRRLEKYQKVVELHRAGYSQRAIAESLVMQRKTVARWLGAESFPERKKPARAPSRVEEHAGYLQQRWNEGCHNATTLYREIQKRGYTGGRKMVSEFVSGWRKTGKAELRTAPKKIAPKHAAILACKPADKLSEQQQLLYKQLVAGCPTLGLLGALAQDFRQALLGNDSGAMQDWIRTATGSGIGPLVRFGFGLKKDLAAVVAAIDTPWSSGQVEGQINRLKAIKRQMYGRASFTLLRSRVLPFTPAAPP